MKPKIGVSPQRRARWLKTLHQWHWISSALCLMGMLLFSVTGITLNHASQIEAQPQVTRHQGQLGAELQALVAPEAGGEKKNAPLPPAVREWLRTQWKIDAGSADAEWSPEEAYLSMPRPGGDAWVRVDRANGDVEYERTDRGWISYFNDLHKGRHTGVAWSGFLDVFAAACLVFSVTGLFLLKMHAPRRPTTWPMVGLGALVPLLLAVLFIH